MKFLKIFALFIITPAFAFSQVKTDTIKADRVETDTIKEISLPPIKYNYKNCSFTIKTNGWNNGVVRVTTTLLNNSDDTLKYKMETYLFLYYKVDNTLMQLQNASNDSSGNIPGVEIILPHQSRTREINLIMVNNKSVFHGKIKVGFYLKLRRGNELMGDFIVQNKMIYVPKDQERGHHWIWSNFVNI